MADFYGALADAAVDHHARGNTVSASSKDELKTAALVRASQVLDAIYGNPRRRRFG